MNAIQPRGPRTARSLCVASVRAAEGRIRAKISPEPMSGCWLWLGSLTTSGYGEVKIDRRARLAHRVVWTLERGAIPLGGDLLHSCNQATCVNPAHLRVGTQADNNADMKRAGIYAEMKARRARNLLSTTTEIEVRHAV